LAIVAGLIKSSRRTFHICKIMRAIHFFLLLSLWLALPLAAPEAVLCGVYGYLSKPFRAAELELLLLRLAERKASHSLQDIDSGLYHRAGAAAAQLGGAQRAGRGAAATEGAGGHGPLRSGPALLLRGSGSPGRCADAGGQGGRPLA